MKCEIPREKIWRRGWGSRELTLMSLSDDVSANVRPSFPSDLPIPRRVQDPTVPEGSCEGTINFSAKKLWSLQ